MNRFTRNFVVVVAMVVMAACGGAESSNRTKNSALTTSAPLPVSCAQLITETATAETTSLQFSLCDDAVKYAIDTPDGVEGEIQDTSVNGGEIISVPVSPTIDGDPTTLVVQTQNAIPEDPYMPGVHSYSVSLATVTADQVAADNPLLGTLYPRVVYTMPPPQPRSVYQRGPAPTTDGDNVYAKHIDDLVHAWSMLAQQTCYSSVAKAVMATPMVFSVSGALSHIQLNAKVRRNRAWFIYINSLRFMVNEADAIRVCPPGSTGFNIFLNGVNEGFVPITEKESETSTNAIDLLKSFALVSYWSQIVTQKCPATSTHNPKDSVEVLDTWTKAIKARLDTLRTDAAVGSELWTINQQVDLIEQLAITRDAGPNSDKCSMISAGYSVPVKKTPAEIIEDVALAVEPPVASDNQSNASAPPSLSDIASSEQTVPTVPQSQLQMPGVSTAPRLKIGSTMSTSRLAAVAGLRLTARSTVRLQIPAASQKVCRALKSSVRAVRVGTCTVRVSVATKGKKTQAKNVQILIQK